MRKLRSLVLAAFCAGAIQASTAPVTAKEASFASAQGCFVVTIRPKKGPNGATHLLSGVNHCDAAAGIAYSDKLGKHVRSFMGTPIRPDGDPQLWTAYGEPVYFAACVADPACTRRVQDWYSAP